jgi:hypothetical protein
VNVTEGATPVSNINNAVRKLMADMRLAFTTGLSSFFAGTAALPIANGGTGGINALDGRTRLGAAASGANSDITSLSALSTPLSVLQGGTGSSSAAAALAALGGVGVAASSLATNPGYIRFSNGFTLQWGRNTVGGGVISSQNFATPFASSIGFVVSSYATPGLSDGDNVTAYNLGSLTAVGLVNGQTGALVIDWLAGGV